MLPCGRHENRRAKVALAGGKCQYRRAEALALAGLNDTPADHVVTAVQHRGLPGTEGALWYGEMNTQCVVEEIEVFHEAGGAEQALLWTEHDRIGRRLHTLHIQPLSGGDAESAPLTGCVKGNALVPAHLSSLLIDERAGILHRGHFRFEKGPVIAMTHKADFLAFLQFVDRQSKRLRFCPYLGLLHRADGKMQPRQPVLADAIQKIALILFLVG